MGTVAAIGEPGRVAGWALAGVRVLPAEDAGQALAAWRSLPPEVAVVILTAAADRHLRTAIGNQDTPLRVVLPP